MLPSRTGEGGGPPGDFGRRLLWGAGTRVAIPGSVELSGQIGAKVSYRVSLPDNASRNAWFQDDSTNGTMLNYPGVGDRIRVTRNSASTDFEIATLPLNTEFWIEEEYVLTNTWLVRVHYPAGMRGYRLTTTSARNVTSWVLGGAAGGGPQFDGAQLWDFRIHDGGGELRNHWLLDDDIADGGDVIDIKSGQNGVLTLGAGQWVDGQAEASPALRDFLTVHTSGYVSVGGGGLSGKVLNDRAGQVIEYQVSRSDEGTRFVWSQANGRDSTRLRSDRISVKRGDTAEQSLLYPFEVGVDYTIREEMLAAGSLQISINGEVLGVVSVGTAVYAGGQTFKIAGADSQSMVGRIYRFTMTDEFGAVIHNWGFEDGRPSTTVADDVGGLIGQCLNQYYWTDTA